MKKLFNYFLQGLVFLVPLALTAYVVFEAFTTIDSLLGIDVPGVGFTIVVVAVTLMGFLASNFLTRRVMRRMEHALDRFPFVRLMHRSTKDLMSAVIGDKRRFDKPVAVALFPGSSVRVLGFLTRESLEPLRMDNYVAVYLPQSYNFAGQTVLVPREHVTFLDVPSSAVMAFVLSAGVTSPADSSIG